MKILKSIGRTALFTMFSSFTLVNSSISCPSKVQNFDFTNLPVISLNEATSDESCTVPFENPKSYRNTETYKIVSGTLNEKKYDFKSNDRVKYNNNIKMYRSSKKIRSDVSFCQHNNF